MATKKVMLSIAPHILEETRIVAEDRGLSLSSLTTVLYNEEITRWNLEKEEEAPLDEVEKRPVGRPRLSDDLKLCREIGNSLRKTIFNQKKLTDLPKYLSWYRHYEDEMDRMIKAEDVIRMVQFRDTHPWWKPPVLDEKGIYTFVPPADGKKTKQWDGKPVGTTAVNGISETVSSE